MKRIVLLVVATIVATLAALSATPQVKVDSVVNKEVKIIKTDVAKSQKDSILYSKLSAEQLLELKREEALVEKRRIEASSSEETPLTGFQIVIIVILMALLLGANSDLLRFFSRIFRYWF